MGVYQQQLKNVRHGKEKSTVLAQVLRGVFFVGLVCVFWGGCSDTAQTDKNGIVIEGQKLGPDGTPIITNQGSDASGFGSGAAVCGDGDCSDTEDTVNCVVDCNSNCGDGACNGSENTTKCPEDCGQVSDDENCGDGKCTGDETTASCVIDCGSKCSDGVCNGTETSTNCPQDCGSLPADDPNCGNGTCDEQETTVNCVVDCGSQCGDKACNGTETVANCPVDCGNSQPLPQCGDGVCAGEENATNCVPDCGKTPPVAQCGDGACNGNESTANCESDCGSKCGDGACNGNEGSGNCVEDCGAKCGDGTCNGGENSANCESDCGSPPVDVGKPEAGKKLKGYVGSVVSKGAQQVVKGWACHPGWNGSIDVHLYVGGPAGQGTIVKGAKANHSNEPAVNAACGGTKGSHRYEITVTASELKEHGGKLVYVHGISPVGSGNFLLTQSGKHMLGSGGNGNGGGGGDCGGCLGQAKSCDQACQGIGKGGGFCKFPGSTNPGACCECSDTKGGGNGGGGDKIPFDLNKVKWLHTNVSGWAVTSKLKIKISGGTICLEHPKKSVWPSVDIKHTSGKYMIPVNANPWVFVQYGGQWYAATWEWMKIGNACRNMKAVAGDHIKKSPLGPANWKPKSGEELYFMVSGLARFSHIKNVKERTDIVKVIWP